MSVALETRPIEKAPRRRGEWFDFPDLFRWFDDRRPLFVDDSFRVEQEMVDGKFHLRAEVPGIDPIKDASVTVADGLLTIKIERSKKEMTEKESGYRTEFRYGSFTRSLAVPRDLDASKVSATYRDGILEVTVPLPATATPVQKVAISRA